MPAHEHLGSQFDYDPASIPQPFGTTPVPPGHVRVNHYTSDAAIPGIVKEGLLMRHAHESYARSGTEYPSIFANAGPPDENLLRARPVAEVHIDTRQLDIGSGRDPADLEARRSTVTTNQDVPPENIIAIHQPWHSVARYMQEDAGKRHEYKGQEVRSTRHEVAMGHHDNLMDDPQYRQDYGPAIKATKITNAATVMLGGRL